MSFTVDAPSTEAVLRSLLDAPLAPLPAQTQKVGACEVTWREVGLGDVHIRAHGGSADDRHYASEYLALQLSEHGYRRHQFDVHQDVEQLDSGRITSAVHLAVPGKPHIRLKVQPQQQAPKPRIRPKLTPTVPQQPEQAEPAAPSAEPTSGGWPAIMAKAKRLIQSGQVTVLRNGFNYIVGHVIGDHGAYDTELSRDDPNSRAITGWQCSCPWDQYAWQRTRKWKKYEGRPCAHVMALYWQALATPMDDDLTPEQKDALGTGQRLESPAVPEHPEDQATDPADPEGKDKLPRPPMDPKTHDLPRSFGPDGEIIQGDQLQLPGVDATGGPPGPAQAPLAPPPSGPQPAGIIPPFPGEQMQMQWGGPGTTPGGGVSPPGAYSQPGAKPPGTPPNPIQQPGTYSRTAADFQAPQVVRLKNDGMGQAQGPEAGQYGDGEYRNVPAGTLGEVRHQDERTGWVEVAFPLDDTGSHEPFHVVMYLTPSEIEPTNQTNAFIQRR